MNIHETVPLIVIIGGGSMWAMRIANVNGGGPWQVVGYQDYEERDSEITRLSMDAELHTVSRYKVCSMGGRESR